MEVSGADLWELAQALRRLPVVDQITLFGNTLHVTVRDPQQLFESISRIRERRPHRWEPIAPGAAPVRRPACAGSKTFAGYAARTSFSKSGCLSSTLSSFTSASGGLVLPFS